MKPIVAPIRPGDSSPQVTNLQDALFLLVDRQIIRALDAPKRPTMEELQKLSQGLKDERAQSLFGEATRELILHFQIQQGLGDNLSGVVEDETSTRLNEVLKSLGQLNGEAVFVVRGTVRDSNGEPSANVIVRAFDRDLRKEQRLGVTKTDDQGCYEIRYTSALFITADSGSKASPDLLLCVYDANDKDLAKSPIRFNAGREETIDLVIPVPARSEWEIIFQALVPLLNGQGPDGNPLPPWALNDEDISFIVEETGLDREHVRLWILASKRSREAELITTVSSVSVGNTITSTAPGDYLEVIAFYGWFRDGQPEAFTMLIRRSVDALMASFERAIQARYIPVATMRYADQLRTALVERR